MNASAFASASLTRRFARWMRASLGRVAVAATLGLSGTSALADCSRPIVVPASPLGRMIVIHPESGTVDGIYPELLRKFGKSVGCSFEFPVVAARARAEKLVQTGDMDLLVGAVRNPQREAWGRFVPLMEVDWMLISRSDTEPPGSVQELLSRPGIRFNAVRGYNPGPEYQAMVEALGRRHALEYVVDATTVVRKMQMGRADFSLMPAGTFEGALDAADAQPDVRKRVRMSSLSGLPSVVTGVYISAALPEQDALALQKMFDKMAHDGALMVRLHDELPAPVSATYRELPSR